MNIYAATLYAARKNSLGLENAYRTIYLIAENEQEANKVAQDECQRVFPAFTSYQVGIIRINQDIILSHPNGEQFRIRLEKQTPASSPEGE